MKNSSLGVLAFSALLVSCDENDQQKNSAVVPEKSPVANPVREGRFGPWLSKAQLRFQMEQPEFQGKFYSQIEGRLHGNENQFRAITEKFDDEKYREWTAVWGVSEEELFEHEIELLREGFERHSSQTFTNTSGKALHQLVMLRSVFALTQEPTPITGFRSPEPEPPESIPEEIAIEVLSDHENISPPDLVAEPEPEPIPDAEEVAVDQVEPVEEMEDVPPSPDPPVAEVVDEPAPEPEPVPEPVFTSYKVVAGDTLSSIARRHQVTIVAIKKANNLRSDVIRLRQVLKIPKGGQ